MNLLAMVFDLGSDEDVAFEKRQLLEVHAHNLGFEVIDDLQSLLGPGKVVCVDRTGMDSNVREFMSYSTVNRLTPERIVHMQTVILPEA